MFHLGVGRSQIEWKLKAKTQISVFPWAKIGQNDHSNPYIGSTRFALFWPMGKLKFEFSLSVSTQFSQSCRVLHLLLLLLLLLLLPVENQYLNNRNSNKHENLHVYIFFSWRVHCLVIFSLTLLLLVLLIVISTNSTNSRIMQRSTMSCNSVCRRRRKLSSHVRGERGRSSFSMVDSEDSSD